MSMNMGFSPLYQSRQGNTTTFAEFAVEIKTPGSGETGRKSKSPATGSNRSDSLNPI